MPLLKKAAQVVAAEIAVEDELAAAHSHLKDVVAWLERHGVKAASIAPSSTGNDAAQLSKITRECDADLVVASAYGHSRLRE